MPHMHRRMRACKVCGRQYRPSYFEQRTCGRACGAQINAAVSARRAAGKATAVRWKTCPSCQTDYTAQGRRRCGCLARAPRTRVFITDCQGCAELFCSPFTISTCSPACATIKRQRDKRTQRDRRRALERNAFVSHVDRLELHTRDNWICQLCGEPVDRKAEVPAPLAATLDHILPLSRGGLHEPANCQTAHYLCNSRKGARVDDPPTVTAA